MQRFGAKIPPRAFGLVGMTEQGGRYGVLWWKIFLTTVCGGVTKIKQDFLQNPLLLAVVPLKKLCYNVDTKLREYAMNIADIQIEKEKVQKLLLTANPDGALLYLYLCTGNEIEKAAQALNMSQTRVSCAEALLRQLGLWQPEQKKAIAGERPNYSEKDVILAMDQDRDFKSLYSEIQRLLGRNLNTEELKIILSFVRYLGLAPEVVCVLVCYCKEKARQKGSLRNPSLRAIEKEAYAWAERGIDTMEEAAAFIQRQNVRNSQLGKLLEILQIRGRNLTPGEEKLAKSWLEMGFDQDVLAEAYQRTCLNTGGFNWRYMNTILTRWHEANLHTLEQIAAGDNKKPMPKGASGKLGAAELEAIQKLMQED